MNDTISIILTIYNQESIIEKVFSGIADNISEKTKEIIIVFDGCVDKTEENIKKVYYKSKVPIKEFTTNNLNEVLANNFALKKSECDYSIIVQDDCFITEKNFDSRMLKPFKIIPEQLIAVSGRDADDYYIENGTIITKNTFGVDAPRDLCPKNVLGIRDAINRSPLMLDNKKMRQLNYFDEAFAPINKDDIDLCLRAYKEYGYVAGAFQIDFHSPLAWGKTRNDINSYNTCIFFEKRNIAQIISKHSDYLFGYKHSMNIVIE